MGAVGHTAALLRIGQLQHLPRAQRSGLSVPEGPEGGRRLLLPDTLAAEALRPIAVRLLPLSVAAGAVGT